MFLHNQEWTMTLFHQSFDVLIENVVRSVCIKMAIVVLGSFVCVALEISSVTIHISNHRGPFSEDLHWRDYRMVGCTNCNSCHIGAQRYDRRANVTKHSRYECAPR